MAQTVTITGEEITLSLISWRRHKRRRPGYVESVLALNPGLAAKGVHIPVGTTFILPDDPVGPKVDDQAVALWD